HRAHVLPADGSPRGRTRDGPGRQGGGNPADPVDDEQQPARRGRRRGRDAVAAAVLAAGPRPGGRPDPTRAGGRVPRAGAGRGGALVVGGDVPRRGRRLRDMRNGFALPPGVTAANLRDEAADLVHRPAVGASGVAVHTNYVFDPSLSWDDVAWLRETTRLPLV